MTTALLSLFSFPNSQMQNRLNTLIQEAVKELGHAGALQKMEQWQLLSTRLKRRKNGVSIASDVDRKIIIEFIKHDSLQLYNPSYFNRSNPDQFHLQYLRELGPPFFMNVVEISSKLKLIYRHFYKQMLREMKEDHISVKIVALLSMCATPKRGINSSRNKFMAIVEDEDNRLEITKQLTKKLREAWRKQKQLRKHPQNNENYSIKATSKDQMIEPAEWRGQNSEDWLQFNE